MVPHTPSIVLCQPSARALKGLKEEDVREVTILNPISYGDYLQKEIIVDTLVELNNNEI